MTESNDKLIEKYFGGDMDAADAEEFRRLLLVDPDFADRLTHFALDEYVFASALSLQGGLKAMSSPANETPLRGKSFSQQYLRESARHHWVRRFVAMAASLAIIAGGYWYFSHAKASGQFIASVETMGGQVEIARGTKLVRAEGGTLILDQDTITVAPGASAEVRYTREDTAVTLLSATTAKFSANSEGMQVWLNAGKLACEVAHQPAGRPMRFITPQAVAEVLGTKLSLAVSNAATRLEVLEGSVKLTKNDGASIVVKEGDFAVAAAGVDLKAQSLTPLPVIIQPGQDIQQAIDKNPEGTKFTLKSGLYRLQSLSPKQGDVFEGEPGTVLNGARLLTTFAREGKYWVAVDQRQKGQVRGESAPGYPGAEYPEDLFVNDQPLVHVRRLADVGPGKWFFDYDAHKIYLGDDPAGRKVETSVQTFAFSGSVSNVTLKNLVIEKYACPAQVGAIGGEISSGPGWERSNGSGWVIENCEIRLNHGRGINISQGWIVRNCRIVHNGQIGIGAFGADDMILENSEISFNNFAHFNSGWESGGLKIMKSRNLVIRNNRVCNNDGAGLLTEWDNFNTLYEGNTVTNNSILGIAHFTSGKAVIRNNIVRNNGTENSVWLWNGQIILRSSRDIDISSNTVEVAASGGNGITIIQQNAGSGIHGPFVSVNNFCHDNDITMCGRTGLNGAAADFGKDTMLNGHNRFDANRYHVTSTNEAHWNWDTPKTWQEFRAAGHEVHGTVDEKMPSRGDSVKLEFRIMKTERMLKSMHSASELKRATPITKGRLEQKIAKFAKKENNEPFAAFAAFCSNLLSFTDSDMFPSSPGRLRRTSRVSIFGFRMLTVSVIHMDSDEQ